MKKNVEVNRIVANAFPPCNSFSVSYKVLYVCWGGKPRSSPVRQKFTIFDVLLAVWNMVCGCFFREIYTGNYILVVVRESR